MEDVIRIEGMTKDFGLSRGIFGVDLNVRKGEAFGLVGINGSGKTTLIRHLMGFLKPMKGKSSIKGMDCWGHADTVKRLIGYIPGEISFPEVKSGMDFLKLQADYMGLRNMKYAEELIERLNLDPTAKLKRMSKGMKQKTAIVNAFMTDSDILLLDEPTTGLDPLMQKSFTEILKAEKKKGKTVFMSSHMFDEMETTCDRVAFIKNGHILRVVELSTIRGNEKEKEYKIEFAAGDDYMKFLTHDFNVTRVQDVYFQATIRIHDENVDSLFRALSGLNVKYITHKPYTLEACFKDTYNESEAGQYD